MHNCKSSQKNAANSFSEANFSGQPLRIVDEDETLREKNMFEQVYERRIGASLFAAVVGNDERVLFEAEQLKVVGVESNQRRLAHILRQRGVDGSWIGGREDAHLRRVRLLWQCGEEVVDLFGGKENLLDWLVKR